MKRLSWQKTDNKIVCLVNLLLSIFAGFCVGMILNYFMVSQFIICGSVAIISTVTEHYLTVYAIKKEKNNEDI